MNNKRLMSLNCQIFYHCVLYNPLLMTIFKRTKASAFQLFQGFILIQKLFTCVLIPTRILTILKYYKWMTRGRTQFNTQVSLYIANSFCKLLQDTKNECGLFQVPLFSSARQRNRSKKVRVFTLFYDSTVMPLKPCRTDETISLL